jgi:hypothetical protein
MDSAPIFSLFREALPWHPELDYQPDPDRDGARHEQLDFEAAVKKAQDLGIAETDSSFDLMAGTRRC